MAKKYIIYENYFLTNDFINHLSENNKELELKELELKKIKNKLFKTLRYIHFYFNIPAQKYWFENPEILNEINDYQDNTILLFDLGMYHTKFISNKFTRVKIKLWIWNQIDNKFAAKQIKFISSLSKDIYTFDNEDAKKYKLKHLNQFYWRNIGKSNQKKEKIFFVGIDKGRIDQILNIKKILSKTIETNFFIVPNSKKKYSAEQKKILSSSHLKYSEVLKHIQESKYLLEINKADQTGLTVRALEALFFETKLITNNQKIEEYDFYHPNNIFILQENINQEDFKSFLQKEYVSIENDVKEKYYYTTWLEKILGEV